MKTKIYSYLFSLSPKNRMRFKEGFRFIEHHVEHEDGMAYILQDIYADGSHPIITYVMKEEKINPDHPTINTRIYGHYEIQYFSTDQNKVIEDAKLLFDTFECQLIGIEFKAPLNIFEN